MISEVWVGSLKEECLFSAERCGNLTLKAVHVGLLLQGFHGSLVEGKRGLSRLFEERLCLCRKLRVIILLATTDLLVYQISDKVLLLLP